MENMSRVAGRKFTLTELLVVIAVIAILASLLTPTLRKAVGAAKSLQCLNNERQLGLAFLSYIGEYSGYMPIVNAWSPSPGIAPYDWFRSLGPYLSTSVPTFPSTADMLNVVNVQQCPEHTAVFMALGGSAKKTMPSFGMNGYLGLSDTTTAWRRHTRLRTPSKTLCITESGWWGSYQVAQQVNGFYLGKAVEIHDGLGVHRGQINILWCDGSASPWFNALRLNSSPYSPNNVEDRWKKGF